MLRPHLRRLMIWLGPALLLVPVAVNADAREDSAEPNAPLIKAAIVLNLCKYVEWPPPQASEPPRGPLVIAYLGLADDEPALASLNGKRLRDRWVEVRRLESPAQLSPHSVLFISRLDAPRLLSLLEIAHGRQALLISEIKGFAAAGGMVEIARRGLKTGFFVNKQAIEDEQLRLSSQLLKLATIVEREKDR